MYSIKKREFLPAFKPIKLLIMNNLKCTYHITTTLLNSIRIRSWKITLGCCIFLLSNNKRGFLLAYRSQQRIVNTSDLGGFGNIKNHRNTHFHLDLR